MDWLSKAILGFITLLLALVGWFTKSKVESVEEAIKDLSDDIGVMQERMLDLDKRSMREETRIEGISADVKRMEREAGKLDGSLGKLHTRIDELKDLIYEKTGK